MKKLLLLLLLSVSCAKEPHVDAGAGNPGSMGSAVAALNGNIKALDQLAQASLSGTGIKTCLPQKSGEGYAILFTDGKSASIRTSAIITGKGSGKAEDSPIVGIRSQGGGFEWTVDGAATGHKAGIADALPSFIYEDGELCLCFENKTYARYKVKDRTISSFFKEISSKDGVHTIHFHDGTSLTFSSVHSEDIPPQYGNGVLRRPVSPQQPMWIIHIDSWLQPDPQKIIDLIPSDIRPYVVFNISLSVEGDRTTGKWTKVEYAYETAKSWLRTCAMNKVWAMIQPASGAYCHFKDTETYAEISESLYAEFFREYPNFLGFNYCEQFWGFDEEFSVSYQQRLVHWTNLMKLTHEYGGYLTISCCGPYYAASLNPVAMIKRGGDFAEMCRRHPENLIICEKFTSRYGFYNNESACLGMWLAGLAGQYGIRYDICGWNGTAEYEDCPSGAGIIAHLEHIVMTGGTVIDGPELIWKECFKEAGAVKTADGYTPRKWEMFPQFENISIDLFRKIIDGTVRIPEKHEVIDKSGIIMIHDINSGNDQQKYTAPAGFYDGLYQMDDDGDLLDNRTWFKKTGRYPAIPYAAELNGSDAQRFKHKASMSEYSARWADADTKQKELADIYPEEYSGDIYAGRMGNSWVTYNPFKETRRAEGIIHLKLNTCDRIGVSHPEFSAAVINEFPDRLVIYMNNYDTGATALKTDKFSIYGANSTPSVRFIDRGNHSVSVVGASQEGEAFVISVSHNGPVELEISCSGNHTGKTAATCSAAVIPPAAPEEYLGDCQFEAEHFDYKNISSTVKNGCSGSIREYTGLGYMQFGQKAEAAARISFQMSRSSQYAAAIRYMTPSAGVTSLTFYVNGNAQETIHLPRTGENIWNTHHTYVNLEAGRNTLEIRASGQLEGELLLDNIVLIPVNRQ